MLSSAELRKEEIPYPLTPPDIDHFAYRILSTLKERGYKAYIVGGFVRDHLLGLSPKDIDIVCDATPSQLRRIFRNARVIGKRFRLVHIYKPDKTYIEISTFRKTPTKAEIERQKEERQISSKHLKHIANNIYGTPEQDALRRDFSVNCMLYDPIENQLVDFFGALDHIKKKRFEIIGNVKSRFEEDPVRMIRACKLSGKQKLSIPKAVIEAIKAKKLLIKTVPSSRLCEETLKILKSGFSLNIFLKLRRYGILKLYLPFIEKHLGIKSRLNDFLSYIDGCVKDSFEINDEVLISLLGLICLHEGKKLNIKGSLWNGLVIIQSDFLNQLGVYKKKIPNIIAVQECLIRIAPELVGIDKRRFKPVKPRFGDDQYNVAESLNILVELKILNESKLSEFEKLINEKKKKRRKRSKKKSFKQD